MRIKQTTLQKGSQESFLTWRVLCQCICDSQLISLCCYDLYVYSNCKFKVCIFYFYFPLFKNNIFSICSFKRHVQSKVISVLLNLYPFSSFFQYLLKEADRTKHYNSDLKTQDVAPSTTMCILSSISFITLLLIHVLSKYDETILKTLQW